MKEFKSNENASPVINTEFKLGGSGCIPMHDVLFNEPAPLDFVMPGVLSKTVGSIVAAGATGKSFFGLSMCADLATGANTLGLDIPEAEGYSVYITLEDPDQVLARRIHDLGSAYNEGDKCKISQRMIVESMAGQIHNLIDQNGMVNQKLLNEMCHQLMGARLIVLDTLRRFHGGDENSNGHMATLISCFEVLAHYTGAAVIFLHHVNKGAALNGSALEQGASRGASALTDNVRSQFNLSRMSVEQAKELGIAEADRFNYVAVINSKMNYGESKPESWLKRCIGGVLAKVDLGRERKSVADGFGGERYRKGGK